jgi:phospholipid-binding lipoprotein MlaA
LRATQLIDGRAGLLDISDILENASLDPYAFTRDAYLQSRESHVQDAL